MQMSLDKLYADQMEAFENYKSGMTSKELFLEQKSAYKQMEDRLDEGNKGLVVTDEQITATVLIHELVDLFIERINVWPGNKMEIVRKIKK